jgi:tripartite-type tricarboxylate transporter receptor subunit TctC
VIRVRNAVAAALLVLLVVGGCNSGDSETGGDSGANNEGWTPEYKDGKLQPLPDGFPNRPITLLNADAPEHDDGLYARAIQTALQGISPVAIEVRDQNYPTFGTWAGIQYMQDQSGGKEGYIAEVAAMVGASLDLLTEPIEDEFGMTLEDFNPVIVTEQTPFVLVTRSDAPWKSYQEMIDAAKASPNTLRYAAASGSLLDIATNRLMKAGSWNAKVIPMEASVDAATAVAAGEADFTMLTPAVARSHEQAGKVTALLVVSKEAKAAGDWSAAVTTAGIGLPDEPWVSYRGFIVAPEVSQAHKDWLFELFKKAGEQSAPKERIANLPGAQSIVLNGQEIGKIVADAKAFAEPIIRDLGLAYDQK